MKGGTQQVLGRQSVFPVALLALSGAFCVMSPVPIRAEGPEPTLPESLMAAIRSVAPGAVWVSPQETDVTGCAPVGSSPSMVRADFNGDRRDDYALLLKTKDTDKLTIWEGKDLRQAHFALALFLADGVGGYKARVLRHYLDFRPTSVVLQLQPAGRVRHPFTHQAVTLKNPGVTLSFCEKSATTYYLAGGHILSIPIAD